MLKYKNFNFFGLTYREEAQIMTIKFLFKMKVDFKRNCDGTITEDFSQLELSLGVVEASRTHN